ASHPLGRRKGATRAVRSLVWPNIPTPGENPVGARRRNGCRNALKRRSAGAGLVLGPPAPGALIGPRLRAHDRGQTAGQRAIGLRTEVRVLLEATEHEAV